LELRIEKMIYGGDGLARLPADEHGRGKAVFLPFVLPEELAEASIVEQKPGFARARADRLIEPSPHRIEPRCRYFQSCGGCHYQHADYAHQLAIKAGILRENLRRITKVEVEGELHVRPSPPWNYRNRTRLRVQSSPEFAVGYYKFNSHELLPVEECPISSPLINGAVGQLWKMGRDGVILPGLVEIEFFANSDDTQVLAELFCSRGTDASAIEPWATQLRSQLPELTGLVAFAETPRVGRQSPAVEPKRIAVIGSPELTYATSHGSYRVSAGSFFQVNRHLIGELVEIVTRGRCGQAGLDLYAGVGLFSTALAGNFHHIVAVESSQNSHSDLQYNSPAKVKAVCATVEQYLAKKPDKFCPELVVVDPPRSGLGDKVAGSIAKMGSPRVTYVSCDPATLARDLKVFLNAGYRLDEVHLVDLFPQTFHLESVVQLIR
jgi:23S rRNA (uracil1939-C5)-methyltransferase